MNLQGEMMRLIFSILLVLLINISTFRAKAQTDVKKLPKTTPLEKFVKSLTTDQIHLLVEAAKENESDKYSPIIDDDLLEIDTEDWEPIPSSIPRYKFAGLLIPNRSKPTAQTKPNSIIEESTYI